MFVGDILPAGTEFHPKMVRISGKLASLRQVDVDLPIIPSAILTGKTG
jgi:hypothetical protein